LVVVDHPVGIARGLGVRVVEQRTLGGCGRCGDEHRDERGGEEQDAGAGCHGGLWGPLGSWA
jgi:hypothetical protein